MTITIYEGYYDDSYVLVGSKDERFRVAWGNTMRIPTSLLYKNLAEISFWVNNELGEECLFEID